MKKYFFTFLIIIITLLVISCPNNSKQYTITFKSFGTSEYSELKTIKVNEGTKFVDIKNKPTVPLVTTTTVGIETPYLFTNTWADSIEESDVIIEDIDGFDDQTPINSDKTFYAIYTKLLAFKALDDKNEISIDVIYKSGETRKPLDNPVSFQYMLEGQNAFSDYTWTKDAETIKETNSEATGLKITIPANKKIYFKGNNLTLSKDSYNHIRINFSKDAVKVDASGSVMALMKDKDNIPSGFCFARLFEGCKSLKTPPEVTAKVLNIYCYLWMFKDCTSLLRTPGLTATELANNCYSGMFRNCSALVEVPFELPATILKNDCYYSMFDHCSSLTQAPKLPAETLTTNCYSCMFESCTALEEAPELLAPTLVAYCYHAMFRGCTSLRKIKCLAENPTEENTLTNWVINVPTSGGEFIYKGDVSWPEGNSGIPTDWTRAPNP